MDRRFVLLVLAVSAMSAIAASLLVGGIRAGAPVRELGGALVALLAGLGVVVLARVVVLNERRRGRR